MTSITSERKTMTTEKLNLIAGSVMIAVGLAGMAFIQYHIERSRKLFIANSVKDYEDLMKKVWENDIVPSRAYSESSDEDKKLLHDAFWFPKKK